MSEARFPRQIERLFMKNNLPKLFSFRLRREIPDEQLLHGTPMEERLDRSPAPWILTVVLVWVASAVLLVLTTNYATSAGNLALGSKALRDYRARSGFEYPDRARNKARLEKEKEKVPVFCRIIDGRTKEIQSELAALFACIRDRSDALRRNRKYRVEDSRASRLAADMSPLLLGELAAIPPKDPKSENFQQALNRMLREGILPGEIRDAALSSTLVRVIDARDRVGARPRRMVDIPDPVAAAERLARIVFPEESPSAEEFRRILLEILGGGNLRKDDAKRAAAVAEAERTFRPESRIVKQNDILIRKDQVVTKPLLDLIKAAEGHNPWEQHLTEFLYRIALSLSLLGITIFFVFRIYPDMVQENRAIMLTGSILIASLAVNYLAISLFHNSIAPRIADPITALSLKLAVPIAFCAILLTVTMGYRVAMCAGFFAVAVAVIMLSPENPFVLLLRYLVLAALAGLTVRKVTNYRTLFIRSFCVTFILLLVLNVDEIFIERRTARELAEVAFITAGNAFITAVLTLVALFVFELAFNLSTNMSLMVLCDYNHPLLERLKREAPGTMFHSMTVATLAEDAARAVGANPLKAKAGALFHDIGKLEKARYFIENNRNSDQLHQKLSPAQSARIILGHVLEGLRLAREKRLCRLVRDAIRTHHGDSLVYFFYAKAKAANPDAPVKKSLFQYSGPPPRGRELTIISLADACEAAVRSLERPDPESVCAKVEEIFVGRIRDGQLRNSLLSLRDLYRVKDSFIATFMSIYHGRIAYTTESINEAAAKQMEQPPSSRAGSGPA